MFQPLTPRNKQRGQADLEGLALLAAIPLVGMLGLGVIALASIPVAGPAILLASGVGVLCVGANKFYNSRVEAREKELRSIQLHHAEIRACLTPEVVRMVGLSTAFNVTVKEPHQLVGSKELSQLKTALLCQSRR